MKSYKTLLNSLTDDPNLRTLTPEETRKLREVFIRAFRDLSLCCEKNNLSLMLIGGTVLGAVRHKGFIPWDDDLDVAMTRDDFERLKTVFEQELGEKYILSSPNYKNDAKNRFPMMLVKNTRLLEAGSDPEDDYSKIKIDIFIIENVPQNKVHRLLKGLWCTMLMFIASYEDTYESNNQSLKQYMYKTEEGKKAYDRRVKIGKVFSFRKTQKWLDAVDHAFQYKKKTDLMSIPSGRGHYFGEIRPRRTFVPVSKGMFEGMQVNLPGDPQDYLSNLYGNDYMTLPPVEKRERHFIMDLRFNEEIENV